MFARCFDLSLRWIALFAVLASSAGCATLFRGNQTHVDVKSLPSGATVWVDGQLRGETPLTLSLTRDQPHIVRFALAGHREITVQTDRAISGGYVALNILFTGMVGLAIDAITGRWYNLGPAPLRVVLSPDGQDCSTGACVYLRAPAERSSR